MTTNLTLISGSPRSGTTWLGKIFDSHPDTLYRHEPDRACKTSEIPWIVPISEVDKYRATVKAYFDALADQHSTRVSGKLPFFHKSYHSSIEYRLRQLIILGAKVSQKYIGDIDIPDLVDWKKNPNVNVVLKLNHSLGRLGVISRSLNGSRIILIIRHPCGQIASVIRGEALQKFDHTDSHSEDYGIFRILLDTEEARWHGLTMEGLKELAPVERLAWRWVLANEKAIKELEGLENCKIVRYEDLATKPMRIAKDLFRFAGLGWNPQTEGFIRKSVSSEDKRYYSVFKDPSKSAFKWREELSDTDIERIVRILESSILGRLFEPA
jgi:hypothetical protein